MSIRNNLDVNVDKPHLISGIIVGLLAILVIGFAFGVDYDEVESSEFANATVTSSEDSENLTAGIDAGKNLHFGEVTEGTNVTKTLNINSPSQTMVRTSSEGNISEYLEYEEHGLFRGNHSVDITMITSQPGYFEGNVTLNIEVANNEVTARWLELKNWFYSQ